MSERKEDHWMWHRKCGHASLRLFSKIVKDDLVRGLPTISFNDNLLCEACVRGNNSKAHLRQRTTFPLKELFSGKRYSHVYCG